MTSEKKKDQRPDTLPGLGHFTGTENYYAYTLGPIRTPFKYTDGVRHVAQSAEAYWLLDVVFSHAMDLLRKHPQRDELAGLMVARLRVNDDNSAVFTMEDGNENQLIEQKIEYTDFPAKEQVFFLESLVLLLPSEH